MIITFPLLAFPALTGSNYKEAVTLEMFKESGAIEYLSDVLVGLQLKGAGRARFNANTEKIKKLIAEKNSKMKIYSKYIKYLHYFYL